MNRPEEHLDDILAAPRISRDEGLILGHSREGNPVRGFRFGTGPRAVSLLAGCHADEPVGPRLLRHLVSYLAGLDPADPMLTGREWWIIPHINPDGEARNAVWADDDAEAYHLGRYLSGVLRELPGEDIEFGFPRDEADEGARPENRAAYDWWRTCDRPFALHVSLHGMGFAAGPWFLIERAWAERCEGLKRRCAARVEALGYRPHDVERHGEKGFVRLGRGFCTRPDSRYMIKHFEDLGDFETAGRFRPSSMETFRSLGAERSPDSDTLTLVSEMPLFLTPGVGETLGPPDPVRERWLERIAAWRVEARAGSVSEGGSGGDLSSDLDADAATDLDALTLAAAAEGLEPMLVRDQMDLQWTFLRAGLEQTAG